MCFGVCCLGKAHTYLRLSRTQNHRSFQSSNNNTDQGVRLLHEYKIYVCVLHNCKNINKTLYFTSSKIQDLIFSREINRKLELVFSIFSIWLCLRRRDTKNRPVCYGTSRLKSRVSVVTRYALLKTPTLKSKKH